MVYKVETHNNSKVYFSQLVVEKDALYVTATTTLSNVIRELSRIAPEEKWRTIDIESFINLIYPKWTDTLNQLRLKVEIRKILVELKLKNKDENIRKELNFLEDNLNVLLSDIRFIAGAGIRELNYYGSSVTKSLFKTIFNRLSKTDIFISITNEILNVMMARGFEDRIQENKGNKINKIYFYNINNLDLMRYLIVELLRLAGYEIIFRIPYFKGLNAINKCWDMVYKNSSLFNFENNTENFQDMIKKSKFISFIEGQDVISNTEEYVTTKTYNEISSFRKDIKGKRVISFYKESLKNCMYIENNEELDHCFQSSLGRFLSYLYRCELKNDTVTLDFNTFRELITSGWIETKGWNGIRLFEYLVDNEDYFNDIETIDDILNRISKIKELEEINEIFEEPVKARIKKNKLKRFLSNPFRALAYVNLDKYNITASYFETLTIRLRSIIIRALSEKDGLIDMTNHLNMLMYSFNNEYIKNLYNNGSELEKKISGKVWIALNSESLIGSVHKEEIKDFFNIMLKFNESNHKEQKEELDFSIDHMEGIILRDRMISYKNYKAVYISDLSYKAYETYIENKKILGKVLSDEDYMTIFNDTLQGEHKNIVMRGLELKNASSKAAEPYVKFAIGNLFINFYGKKEFSWIADLREDDGKSTLLKQIEVLYNNEIKLEQELDSGDIDIENEMLNYKEKVYDKSELASVYRNIPEVAYRDLDFCDNKFLFSTVLEDHPMYYSDFHQRLVLSSIVSVLKNSLEDSNSNISKFIFPLFQQWFQVEKDNILTCEYARKNIREYKYFDAINYPKNMDSLYILKSKYMGTENREIRNRYNKGEFRADKYFEEFLKDYLKEESYNSGRHCSMCPHIYVCRKGEFVIDHK